MDSNGGVVGGDGDEDDDAEVDGDDGGVELSEVLLIDDGFKDSLAILYASSSQ